MATFSIHLLWHNITVFTFLAKIILSKEDKALTDNVSLEGVNFNVTCPSQSKSEPRQIQYLITNVVKLDVQYLTVLPWMCLNGKRVYRPASKLSENDRNRCKLKWGFQKHDKLCIGHTGEFKVANPAMAPEKSIYFWRKISMPAQAFY